MTSRMTIIGAVILVASFFAPILALAQCPEGKVEVTILRGKAGVNVMTLCLPEHVVNEIGGRHHIVIPAVCPCDLSLIPPPEDWDLEVASCLMTDDQTSDQAWAESMTGDHIKAVYFWTQEDGHCSIASDGVFVDIVLNLTKDQAHACAADFWAFAVNELGLDCVGEFPDFEPPPEP